MGPARLAVTCDGIIAAPDRAAAGVALWRMGGAAAVGWAPLPGCFAVRGRSDCGLAGGFVAASPSGLSSVQLGDWCSLGRP